MLKLLFRSYGEKYFKLYVFYFYFLFIFYSDVGINDFEPRVINQLLEFTYRYVTTILDDAK